MERMSAAVEIGPPAEVVQPAIAPPAPVLGPLPGPAHVDALALVPSVGLPGIAGSAGANPNFTPTYSPEPAYAMGAPAAGILPPPPPTYPRVEPYVPTYCPPAETMVAHAGFGWRLAAWALDTVILNIAGFIIGFPIGLALGVMGAANGMAEQEIANMANVIVIPLSFLVTFLYCTVLLAWRGQTVGMMACSMKVVQTDGMPIGFGTAVLRYICYFVAAMPCGIGLLWMIWDPECQGWHDKLAKTYVVRVG
jgi:uncharacterized RDD family membrane protein YckC